MKIKPRTLQEVLEGLHDIGQRFGRSRSGVHGLDPVVFRLGQKSVRRVHLVEKLRHDAPDLLPSATLCVWFAVMIIFDKFRALDSQRQQPLPCQNTLAGRFAPLAWASRSKEIKA